ncbi:MAG: 2-succinyl-5-enolpyruvyl-6-hydroxy-3-cyclohexene-1-carboxylic-acid synthase [Myxococcales bacterium]|nr:2-succinyl-5-enolpyruvyl-6-hydroxy-3-cyclohexene-1-carboxylic-acid synthase [Myxococcales bacterium]
MRSFVELGLSSVVASPGSRSTPLVLAAAAEPRLRLDVIVDERSAGFFALGQARVSGRPSLLVCTSGSAGAHYFPAILEAERALLPLIAVTADRPWELELLGANQTLDQKQLFGSHVRKNIQLGEPDAARLAYVPRIAALAVQAALSPVPGPVHVNARFRKPLEPTGRTSEPPRFEVPALERAEPSRLSVPAAVAEAVARARRGLVLCGPRLGDARGDARLRRALAGFVRERGFALLAESTSGVAHGPECASLVLPAFDAWLGRACAEGDAPDLILELGSPATSGAWERLAGELAGVPRITVSEAGLPDPTASATAAVTASPAALIEALEPAGPADDAWLGRLWARARQAEGLLSEALAGAVLSEAFVARALFDALPEGAHLMLGNSLPVRDVDLFAPRSARTLTVLHQRGLSGIDGLIAGTAGARSALPAEIPVFALIGDVSAQHDVGSLALLGQASAPLTLVVVDNAGGRIFGELPVASAISAAELERLFLTPPPDFLGHACRAFGVAYERIDSRTGLTNALAARPSGARLLHVVVPPEDGRARRRALRESLARAPGVSA